MLGWMIGLCFPFVFLFVYTAESHLVKTSRRCIPTSIARGPCHTCVCMVDGLFHCRSEPCNKVQSIVDSNNVEQDCKPGMTYNHKTLYCHCNDKGQWKSENCKNTFFYLIHKTSKKHFRSKINCLPNVFYLRDCNVCYCDKTGVIRDSSCTKRTCRANGKTDSCKYGQYLKTSTQFCACNDYGNYHDRLCIEATSKTFQTVDREELEKILKLTGCTFELSCAPNVIYHEDCKKCQCVYGKLECENKDCSLHYNENKLDAIKRLNTEVRSLPEVNNERVQCKPGYKYRYKCNTCLCSIQGNLECNTNSCLDDIY